jgi:fibronectin type 3 domain-containing protein
MKQTQKITLLASLFLFVILGLNLSAYSQKDTANSQLDSCRIRVISQVLTDSIVLRWAPDHAYTWEMQLANGFIVERVEIPDDTSRSLIKVRLTDAPLKPLAKEDWLKNFGKENAMAMIAAAQIYPELTPLSNPDPILIQQNQNKLQTRHGFALFAADNSSRVADASGLRYVDRSFENGKNYLYRVFYSTSIEGLFSDTAIVFINSSELSKIPIARAPAIIGGDRKVELRWDAGRKSGFSAFHVERALSGTNQFIRLNKNPFVSFKPEFTKENNAYFTDSVENYILYDYRIIGVTAFGELSTPSALTTVMGRDLTPPTQAIITGVNSENKTTIRIKWKVPQIDPDLKSLFVARGYDTNGPFNSISGELAKDVDSFLDSIPNPNGGNFYVVICKDTAGNEIKSLPFYGIVEDNYPPETPAGLAGYIDSSSVVHLTWNLGKEPDLQGYRVYVANASDHEFSNITPAVWGDTIFLDTITKRTLSKYIYYKIVAVDNNYNHSAYSEWIKVRRLDVIPPVAPVFGKVSVTDTTVHLNWVNSSSDDVKEQILYRKPANDSVWLELKRWKFLEAESSFTDRHLPKKQFFEYLLIAVDSSDLQSDSSSLVSIRTFDSGIRERIAELMVDYNKEKKSTDLSWKYAHSGDYSFLIYRALPGKPLTKFKMLKGTDRSFEDKTVSLSGEYSYAVKVIYTDGGESPLSEKKVVRVQ